MPPEGVSARDRRPTLLPEALFSNDMQQAVSCAHITQLRALRRAEPGISRRGVLAHQVPRLLDMPQWLFFNRDKHSLRRMGVFGVYPMVVHQVIHRNCELFLISASAQGSALFSVALDRVRITCCDRLRSHGAVAKRGPYIFIVLFQLLMLITSADSQPGGKVKRRCKFSGAIWGKRRQHEAGLPGRKLP